MSAVLAAPRAATPWRHALPALGLLLLAVLLLYRDAAASMVGIWSRSDTFAHAFLVAPISLWLVWRQRDRLAAMQPRPEPWLLLPLAAAGAAWLVGDVAAVSALTHFTFVAMLVLAVPTVLGLAVARQIAFPLAFLFFMVPIGEFLLPTLMEATADFTVAALQLSGVPVYREGLQFIVPSGNWSVVEACSGVRYLIASFMVGTLFAYLNYRSMRRRWIFAGVALLVPVLANWLRAYLIVMVGHLSDNRIAAGVDHIIYGWVFFGIVIGLMFFIGARWAEPDAAAPPARGQGPVAAASAPAAAALWAVALAGAAVLALPPAARVQMDAGPGSGAAAPLLRLPPQLPGGWQAAALEPGGFKPVFEGATSEAAAAYVEGGHSVHLYLAYYRHQRYRHKLISSENLLVRSNNFEWNQLARGQRDVASGSGTQRWHTAELTSAATLGHPARERLDVRRLYWVGGTLTDSDARAAAVGAFNRLTGRGDDAAAIIISTAGNDAQQTAERLDRFTRAQLDGIVALLASTQAQSQSQAQAQR